jgi:hypothetical protein
MLYAAFGGFRFEEIASRIETVARSVEGTRRV